MLPYTLKVTFIIAKLVRLDLAALKISTTSQEYNCGVVLR